ncbi:MAG: 30S ribosomal protein S12 methylthiotransferase RimO [Candidatus Marinimicrobia bacterium]|nr:30S ribosomal protein S12 methylthiotransferase RimO [Candidatus Neomarinimicrobiota bacterium]MCF7851086.1 30S ribosomal protein S12 methylthiotransferase RimO [Candidatus Neomarinimicrobiota bacterium]MCF7905240.1 30S ribosomal protein S12 methylthiotransferase RimO [Candidatus Neomarinimicrobiota bacterium]
MKKNVHIISLGCVKNTVDSEIIAGGLESAGIELIDEAEDADTIIINTCGFIGDAKQESVEVILEAAELKKKGKLEELLVAGCLSARYRDELTKEMPEVDKFFVTEDFKRIFEHITTKPHLADDPDHKRKLLTPRHYAYLKISEGCDNVCSFCAIPLMRGKQRSRSLEDLVEEARSLVKRGVRELIVIAQDSTTYGWDLRPKRYLHELLTELDQVDGLDWIRLHYAHPSHFSRKLIPVFKNARRIVPYLDIPVQHASTAMLTAMKRGLDADGLRRLLLNLRNEIPELKLRTSVIVGFPGETQDDFDTLLNFLEEIQFDRLGVFTYSEEEDTSGAELEDDVPPDVKVSRMDQVMDLQHSISFNKNQELIGKELDVIIDSTDPDVAGQMIGRSIWDAPEIDQVVYISGEIEQGAIIRAVVDDAGPYELYASPKN